MSDLEECIVDIVIMLGKLVLLVGLIAALLGGLGLIPTILILLF